jgi:hypothetical protein
VDHRRPLPGSHRARDADVAPGANAVRARGCAA